MHEKKGKLPAYYAGYQERFSIMSNNQNRTHLNTLKSNKLDVEQQQSNDNQIRRGGYSSEVAEKVNSENNASDEEPQVLLDKQNIIISKENTIMLKMTVKLKMNSVKLMYIMKMVKQLPTKTKI